MEIKIRELCKSYGKKKALQNFDATFENGIYGILGPNGAGKSTLMNILTDNLLRDSGRILCGGKDILKWGAAYRKSLGYMPQQQQLYETFTVTEFLAYMGTLKGMKKKEIRARMELLFPLLNLDKVKRKKIKELSGGMKQRVLLLQALLNDPKILILDEPTAGLDPQGRDEILGQIERLNREHGLTILVVSHSMEDMARYVDRIMVMNDGVKMFDDTPKEVFRHYKELEAIGLAAPQITYVVQGLRERGIPIDDAITTVEEAREAILALYNKRREKQ